MRLFLALMLLPSLSFADPVCAPSEEIATSFTFTAAEGSVDGYHLHVGEVSGSYDRTVTIGTEGDRTVPFPLSSDRDWYVALSAFGPGGESELSNELVVPRATKDPTGPECPPSAPVLLEAIRAELQSALDKIEALIAQGVSE